MFKCLLAIYISLITCAPGTALYERYGHTAIRVVDTEMRYDLVFNYGTFSFEDKGFYWNFAKGHTMYELSMMTMRDFSYDYLVTNRKMNEQFLNLSYQQSLAIIGAIYENHKEDNRKYLYNFVFDNCATRPYYLIKKALGDSIICNYVGEEMTYRQAISHYTGKDSWEDFGIQLLFGRKANHYITGEERLFLPEELMKSLNETTLPDGRPLVGFDNSEPFQIAEVPWYKKWYWGAALFAVVMLVLSIVDRKRGKLSWGVDLALGIVYALLFLLVLFLVCFSAHPLVGFGWRLLIFPMIHLCARLVYILR